MKVKGIKLLRNLMFSLDIFVGILIIVLSSFLIESDFGRISLTFGIFTTGIIACLRILKKV